MAKVITSCDNPFVKEWVRVRQLKSDKNVLVPGVKRVQELMKTHTPSLLVVTKEDLIPQDYHGEKVVVSESVMKKATGLVQPEGLFALFPLPKQVFPTTVTHLLALDGVSDPGNLGTLFRAAFAFGWDGIFLLPGCSDPWNEKVVRASVGALFHLPFLKGSWEELQQILKKHHLTPLAADMSGKAFNKLSQNGKTLLVLGSEAKGLSKKTREKCQTISIPMSHHIESLNVALAGGILMYYFGQNG